MKVLYLTVDHNRASTTVPTEGWCRFLPPHSPEPDNWRPLPVARRLWSLCNTVCS